jgi:hypothetical protein
MVCVAHAQWHVAVSRAFHYYFWSAMRQRARKNGLCTASSAMANTLVALCGQTKICDTPTCAPSSPHPPFDQRYTAPGPCCIVCAPDFLGITPSRRPLVLVSAVAPQQGGRGRGLEKTFFVFSLFPFSINCFFVSHVCTMLCALWSCTQQLYRYSRRSIDSTDRLQPAPHHHHLL